MASRSPLITGIKGNSLDDGPGIRTVVFFKGCPLSCAWCHNPESRLAGYELSFDEAVCIGCGLCMQICPEHAIDFQHPGCIDTAACTLCFQCVGTCPSGALSRIGRSITVAQILELVLADKPFFSASGGGVTFSGGEPTLHAAFAGELAAAVKENGIHLVLETCGCFHPDAFMEHLCPYLDAIYFDIKLWDEEQHMVYCGMDNRLILENFRFLNRIMGPDSPLLLPRVPLVPEVTDTIENLGAIAEFLAMQGMSMVQLLPYNPLWPEKERQLGRPTAFGEAMRDARFMPQDHIERCESIFRAAHITPVREAP